MWRGATSLVVAALAAAAAGCGGGGSGGPATLTVYVSAPLHGARATEGRAIVDGAKLALAEDRRVGDLRIRAVYLDDTGGGSKWSPVATAANARRAAEDSSAIGYIGELDSGATRVSLPITNQAEMIQISPGATAVDLTLEAYGGPDPDIYRPSGDQTFARIVPADDVQARAAALLAKELRMRNVPVLSDRSGSGEVTSNAFADQAQRLGIVGFSARPTSIEGGPSLVAREKPKVEGIYYGGLPGREVQGLVEIAAAAPAVPFIESDAMLSESLRDCESFAAPIYLTSSMRDPSRLPTRAQGFERAYRAAYGQVPPAAAYGDEAMSLLLDAIRHAGDDRGAVIDDVLGTADRDSIIGRYSIRGDGDTTLDWISVYAVRNCRRSFDRELRAPR